MGWTRGEGRWGGLEGNNYLTPLACRGIATLSDYAEKPGSPPGKDAQQFFAGGSEHSGQMIEGPPRKKDPDTIAKEVFEAAKK